MASNQITPELFRFLTDLKKNNDRAWFEKNKARYEEQVKYPILSLISDLGPLLAKVDPDGMRLQADDKPGRFESELDSLAGAHSRFDPLLVQEIESAEQLLSVWDLCFTGKKSTVTSGTIERRVLEEEGDGVVHQFGPIELKLEREGKVLCQAHFDSLPGGTLAEGKYRVEISVTDGATDELGYHAVENKCEVYDLWATVLHQLGLNHERLTYRHGGRDFRLTDVHGDVLHDVLA